MRNSVRNIVIRLNVVALSGVPVSLVRVDLGIHKNTHT